MLQFLTNSYFTRWYSSDSSMIRLSKLMTQMGLCSRREAEEYIKEKAVVINGKQVEERWLKVDRNSVVQLSPAVLKHRADKVTILLNKPLGYVSAQPEKNLIPAIKLLKFDNCYGRQTCSPNRTQIEPIHLEKMAVCGRLDINSSGLLLFSQDGAIVKQIIGPDSTMEKEYLVRFSINLAAGANLSGRTLSQLRNGIRWNDNFYQAKSVDLINANQLRFVLTEGKKHHIRHMCKAVGLPIKALKRVRIGNIRLGSLPVGKWRYLQKDEKI